MSAFVSFFLPLPLPLSVDFDFKLPDFLVDIGSCGAGSEINVEYSIQEISFLQVYLFDQKLLFLFH
jgi:hypothetical protein